VAGEPVSENNGYGSRRRFHRALHPDPSCAAAGRPATRSHSPFCSPRLQIAGENRSDPDITASMRVKACQRRIMASTYCGSMSIAHAPRPIRSAAMSVVPDPTKVSTTMSALCISEFSGRGRAKPGSSLIPGSSPSSRPSRSGDVMNAVVLTAVLSCLNSGVYTASRMPFVLAGKGEAPAVLTASRPLPHFVAFASAAFSAARAPARMLAME
jgi:Amino acid permease